MTERPSTAPEQLLRQLESVEEHEQRGRLKIFLGYASGVGKTFRMLDEGRRRRERGQDIVIGALQPGLSSESAQLALRLESIPLRRVQGINVIDIPAILRRSPEVCLIDGLAYDNPPASLHPKRWQDVAQLLEAGISVVTSVNLQHIEEKREQVEALTGKRVSQTVPLSFLQTADEIVLVDAPAEGRIRFSDDNGERDVRQKLSRTQLSELREIALFLAADVVDQQLERYLSNHGIVPSWGTQERILVFLTPECDARRMLESGARNRDRFHGELIVARLIHADWSVAQKRMMDIALSLAREKAAEIVELNGENAAAALLRFAHERSITQIFVSHKVRESWWERLFGTDLDKLIRSAEGMDVRVFPYR